MKRVGKLVLASMLGLSIVTGCRNDDRVCLQSHVEVTPAGMYFETRIKTGSGSSVGTGGGIGMGAGSGPAGSVDYGPVWKPENKVTVCDVYATETP